MYDATALVCPDAGFDTADLTTFCRLDELGLVVTGQRLEPDRAVLACRVVEPLESDERWCRRCGCEGVARDIVTRRLAHEPFGWRPTTLMITIRRSSRTGCTHVWRQDTTAAAEPRAKLSRRALRWALEAIVVQHLTVARIAEGLGVAWNTANDAVLAEGRRVLINDPARFDGVTVLGVDEHVWRHTRRGDKYVTVIIDLTPIRDGTGPARLLDMVEGRSKAAFKTWLAERPAAWRDGVEVVAMDGFSGFKTATSEELPEATAVMDPFHVVRLAGDALDRCRRRVQQIIHGHRGRSGDPLYRARRMLHTGAGLLTDKPWSGSGPTAATGSQPATTGSPRRCAPWRLVLDAGAGATRGASHRHRLGARPRGRPAERRRGLAGGTRRRAAEGTWGYGPDDVEVRAAAIAEAFAVPGTAAAA